MQEYYQEPAKEIPVFGSFDVVVAGGGIAGFLRGARHQLNAYPSSFRSDTKGDLSYNYAVDSEIFKHEMLLMLQEAGAAVDVYDVEPPIPDSEPLLHAKNCVLTPHVAFLSEESMIRRAHIAFENTLAYLAGAPENLCAL